jgi:hypothetical protein
MEVSVSIKRRIAVLLTVPLMVMASLEAYSTRKVLLLRAGFPVLIGLVLF